MAIKLDERRSILRFEGAVLQTESDGSGESEKLNLSICGGDFVLMRLARLEQTFTFADACAGLIRATRGEIYFLGKNWRRLSPDQANALRGRIGRVFIAGNWIRQLSLIENILLPQLHHTRRALSEICDEAADLAERFHLSGIPLSLPDDLQAAELRYAACVRAFLGQPELVLLEEPTAGEFFEIISPLINTIREARNRGSAVVWLTRDRSIWNDHTLPVSHRYRLAAGRLMEVTP